MKNQNRKQTLSMQQYNELLNIFKSDDYVLNALKTAKPNTDISNLLDYIADMHENKELTEGQMKAIKASKQLQNMLRIAIDYRKKQAIDVETQASVRNILHFNKTPWLYREMTTQEIITLSETPFNQIEGVVNEMVENHQKPRFDIDL